MPSTKQEKIPADTFKEENILEPSSIKSYYEMLASRYVIRIHRSAVQMILDAKKDFNNDLIDDALEEWDYIALCLDRAPNSEDGLSHHAVLEEIRPTFAALRKLSKDATWNEIIVDEMSAFDDLIKDGVEYGWSWDSIVQLFKDLVHIDTAIRYGASPEISGEKLFELVSQKAWEANISADIIEAENKMKK
ncbi:MAG: hypothetical protein KDD56_09325, partial [Bdellovibrionales bacterium]|nr:hypothetical protein [Bdellovibrionales bacterium]